MADLSFATESGRKARPTFGSTGVDNCATRLGTHTGPEAMFSLALRIAWLKRPFAHYRNPLVVFNTLAVLNS